MAHSVSEAAARAVKNSQKKVVETRTPEQRMADIRKNRAAKLFITPDDQDYLLSRYDDAGQHIADMDITVGSLRLENDDLKKEIARLTEQVRDLTKVILPGLEAKIEEFRSVYESENSSQSVTLEREIYQSGENVDINADQ